MVKTVISLIFVAGAGAAAPEAMVSIPAGSFPQFLKIKGSKTAKVDSFRMDVEPVTNGEFLEFVRNHPEWRKSKVKKIFSDSHYLQGWKGDLDLGSLDAAAPVTFISWFAAGSFCRSHGKDLPSTDQWEYVAYDRGRSRAGLTQKILDWYAKPSTEGPGKIGLAKANSYNVQDMFGLIWEWTLDFNQALSTDEGRDKGADNNMFCGSGSLAATDPSDYATYMRYAFRGSLKANYSVNNLGFRCVRQLEGAK